MSEFNDCDGSWNPFDDSNPDNISNDFGDFSFEQEFNSETSSNSTFSSISEFSSESTFTTTHAESAQPFLMFQPSINTLYPSFPTNPTSEAPIIQSQVSTSKNGASDQVSFSKWNKLSPQDKFHRKTRFPKIIPWFSSIPSAASSDQMFNDILQNPSITLNPGLHTGLGFIPSFFWPEGPIPFRDIILDFFRQKNNINCRFLYKLYNALRISNKSPIYQELVGVSWVNYHVICVNRGQFGRLLGLKSIDGALFHQQGNFPSHGFRELTFETAPQYCPNIDLSTVDFHDVRLLIDTNGIFVSTIKEGNLLQLSRTSSHKKK